MTDARPATREIRFLFTHKYNQMFCCAMSMSLCCFSNNSVMMLDRLSKSMETKARKVA